MTAPFPTDDTNWNVPVRPMNFRVANRAYRPLQLNEVTAPTITVAVPTLADNRVLVSFSAMATTGPAGTIGNQSSQRTIITRPDNTVILNQRDDTDPFTPVTITNFGNQTADNFNVGSLNQGSGTELRVTWPATVLAPVQYSVTGNQGAFDSTNTIPDRFVSGNAAVVNFTAGNAAQALTFDNAPTQGGGQPTFTIVPQSFVGATHASTNWRVWTGTDDFTADGSGRNPFTEARAVVNGTTLDQTFTTGAQMTTWQIPEELPLDQNGDGDDIDTAYTVGVQASFTLDGETFWTPWLTQTYTRTAAAELTNVRIMAIGGGGGGHGQGTNNDYGAGGGAGGMATIEGINIDGAIFTIRVGAGGGRSGGGGNSDIILPDGTILLRGIGGGSLTGDGGCGGGGGSAFTASAGGDALQPTSQWGGIGFDGADGLDTAGQCMVAGGGGGIGGPGQQGSGTVNGGMGGTGATNTFLNGTERPYGGGGSGGAVGDSNCGFAVATASPGFGGGAGNGGNAIDGFGGGGGGACNNRDQGNGNPGGSGGNGHVVITYVADQANYTGGDISSYTDNDGNNRIVHSFSVDGTLQPN